MTEQPRDEKGGVAKKEKTVFNNSNLVTVLILIGFGIGFISGSLLGYEKGYNTDLADNQDVIRAHGFAEGMVIADNQNELKNNWVQDKYFEDVFYNKQDPNTYVTVDKDYNIVQRWDIRDISWCGKPHPICGK